MKSYFTSLSVILACLAYSSVAQTISQSRLTDWSTAGHTDTLPVFSNTVNIMNHGAVADGSTANDNAFTAALSALNSQPGTIYLPAGDYLFTQGITINRDSVVIKGDGANTRLIFDMGGSIVNAINITGNFAPGNLPLKEHIYKNTNYCVLTTTATVFKGDHLMVNDKDAALVFSPWAIETLGQILEVERVSNDTVYFNNEFRRNYLNTANVGIKKVAVQKAVGLECMYIERKDPTTQQTSNISFNKTANCWVIGVESNKCNYSHIVMDYSSHNLVRGCYFHHAHAYGSGGQGYGTTIEYASSDCLIENNTYEHLRHSILVQAGANGNVFAYNYSFDPYWDQSGLPNDAAGDIVCHGNYPFLNLFEGNICQNIVVDDSHGFNGPYNTFFRNRAELYGIFTNNNPATDSMTYAGNEVTNTQTLKGNYLLNGNGHFQHGNNIKSVITPANTGNLPEVSLYLQSAPGYWPGKNSFPGVGAPAPYNQISLAAKDRVATTKIDCIRNPVYVSVRKLNTQPISFDVYPNPFTHQLTIKAKGNDISYKMYSATGKIILEGTQATTIDTRTLPAGIYIIQLTTSEGSVTQKLVKTD